MEVNRRGTCNGLGGGSRGCIMHRVHTSINRSKTESAGLYLVGVDHLPMKWWAYFLRRQEFFFVLVLFLSGCCKQKRGRAS